MRTKIAQLIREQREKAALSQMELGLQIWPDISEHAAQGRIKRIESGDKEPSDYVMHLISKILNIHYHGNQQEYISIQEYSYVKKIYPEIEASIKLLFHAHPKNGPANDILAKVAWESLIVIARQKIKILEKTSEKNKAS